MASVCSFQTSYAQTSTSPALARCAANKLPTAPQPTTQILIRPRSSDGRSQKVKPRQLFLDLHLSIVSGFFTGKKFPRHIGQAFALGFAHAVRVLGIKTNFAVLIEDLRMQREDHVFLQFHIGFGSDRGMLD